MPHVLTTTKARGLVLLPALALMGGCVSAGRYDAAVADSARLRHAAQAQQAIHAARVAADQQAIDALRAELAQLQAQNQRVVEDLQRAELGSRACTSELDASTALSSSLRRELEKMGKDVDQLLSAKGELSSSLVQARARLAELRSAQAAAEARAALLRDVALKLKRMVDAGDLQIALRSGRMVLVRPNDVLFDSGKAELKPRGRETVAAVADALSGATGRRFQVAGHTDDDPIRYSGFPSNWELSTARALAVVGVMVKAGMRPEMLSAAGYAEFDPVSPNDSPESKAKNRRTEITLQPNIDANVVVPSSR